jgi:hypothetical protein
MKLIISHDVDILQISDHLCDLFLVKQIIRNLIECAIGYATGKEFFRRIVDICNNRIHKLDELIAFDRENDIPSTFFFGMANGKHLNYSLQDAAYWIQQVRDAGLSVGVHGVQYDNPAGIQEEHDTFKKISCLDHFGIRMHYLRRNDRTLKNLELAGYAFDSSEENLTAPYKIGQMWEFPLQIMDAYIFYRGRPWINTTFDQARQISIEMLQRSEREKIPFFTILFHNNFFSPAYLHMEQWYRWLIHHARENRFEFIDYLDAVKEMETDRLSFR